MSSFGAGVGIVCHVAAATFGPALLIQTSATAFWVVKLEYQQGFIFGSNNRKVKL